MDAFTHRLHKQAANHRATRVKCDLGQKCSPGELICFDYVVKKFCEIIGGGLDVIPFRTRPGNEFCFVYDGYKLRSLLDKFELEKGSEEPSNPMATPLDQQITESRDLFKHLTHRYA